MFLCRVAGSSCAHICRVMPGKLVLTLSIMFLSGERAPSQAPTRDCVFSSRSTACACHQTGCRPRRPTASSSHPRATSLCTTCARRPSCLTHVMHTCVNPPASCLSKLGKPPSRHPGATSRATHAQNTATDSTHVHHSPLAPAHAFRMGSLSTQEQSRGRKIAALLLWYVKD